MTMKENSVYVENGYYDREDYLNSLKEDFDPDKVDLLSQMLGPDEDFDGLVTMLEDDDMGF